jgi:hypothetical protein
MPTPTPAVRFAAGSILSLSLVHIAFWAILALELGKGLPNEFPFNFYLPVFWIISAAGIAGVVIAIGLFSAKGWARIATLVMGAVVALFCALGMLAPILLISGALPLAALGLDVYMASKSELVRLFVVYLFVFLLAIWWIVLFSRKSTIAQFSSVAPEETSAIPGKPRCPPPIALLAWLMIASSALSALSWPLILGRIPAMLFNHIYAMPASRWIWIANILVFLLCGIGLLRLWRWTYSATIGLHAFWLLSLFVSQLSTAYEKYLSLCLTALEAPRTFISIHINFPPWLSALVTAVPTAVLIVGLFYYRGGFLKAATETRP